ncbi:MAG: dihydropteroate synthase [Bacteroidales bacterium]|nr:dihydropteroate synthase [Bacteroidales bacterium]
MINCRGKLIDLSTPKVMGILNLSHDSFYKGNAFPNQDLALKHAYNMICDGADFIDIGAASSRPGAKENSEKDELKKLLPVLKAIRKESPSTLISIDTFRSKIAEACIEEGADIINDIYAGSYDEKMYDIIAHYKVPYIIMHMKGTPENMQSNPSYSNVINEILKFFSIKIQTLKLLGISDIIIDPGIGFGKSIAHNFEILKKLEYFTSLEYPVLLGLSRKSFIYKTLDNTPSEAMNGTTAMHALALTKNVNVLRVHDVKEAKEVIELYKEYNNFE